jgi:hypothetical protein
MSRTKINKNMITKSMIFMSALLVLFRSVSRPISDYDSYRLTGKLILNELFKVSDKLSYDPSWKNFESRSGNGPIWNLFLSPFQLIPYVPAIILFRLVVIVAVFLLIKKVVMELKFNENLSVMLAFIIMLFPFRFLVNTSQGSSIAYLVGVYILVLILKNNPSSLEILSIGLGIILCLNYKPHLFIPFAIWILVNRKIKIMLSTIFIGSLLEVLLLLAVPNSTQLSWLKYLLARSEHIDAANYQLKFGPLTFFYEFFHLNTPSIYLISLLILIIMGFYFYSLPFNFKSGLVAMSLGVFIGPYSPTHDQTLIALIFGIIFVNQIVKDKFNILLFVPLLFWIYPSEFTILKQLIIFAIYALIILYFSNFRYLCIFVVLFIVNQMILFNWLDSDSIYLITGLGALFAIPFVVRFQYLSFQYKNL